MGVVFLDGSFASAILSGGRTKKAMAEYDRLGHIVTGNDMSYRNTLAGGLCEFLALKSYPAKGMSAAATQEPAPETDPEQEALQRTCKNQIKGVAASPQSATCAATQKHI